MIAASRFDHVLATNHIPSADEVSQIHDILWEAEERLVYLEYHQSSERFELREFITRHRALLSPFRRLPRELWAEIFTYCLPKLPSPTMKEAPLLLMAVCRYWKDMVLGMPGLWAAIHIHIPQDFAWQESVWNERNPMAGVNLQRADKLYATLTRRLNVLKTWIGRSGSYPLTLSIHLGQKSTELQHSQIAGALAAFPKFLLEHIERWKSFTVVQSPSHFKQTIWNFLPSGDSRPDMRMLEEVSVTNQLFEVERSMNAPLNPTVTPTALARFLGRLSRMKSLNITEVGNGGYVGLEHILDLEVRWASLTRLTLSGHYGEIGPESIISKLNEACPRLIGLAVDATYADVRNQPVPADGQPLIWASLRTLDLIFRLPSNTSANNESKTSIGFRTILQSLSTPNLERFQGMILKEMNETPPDIPTTRSFPGMALHRLVSTSHHITHLGINSLFFFVDLEPLLDALYLLDSLKTLTVLNGPGYWVGLKPKPGDDLILRLLETLTVHANDRCPVLETLYLPVCFPSFIDAMVDFALVKPNLKSLRADFGYVVDSDITVLESGKTQKARMNLLHSKGVQTDWTWKPMGKVQNFLVNLDEPPQKDSSDAFWL